MVSLKELKPSELLLLIDPFNNGKSDYLFITFFDLALRNVLFLKVDQSRNPAELMVAPGKAFRNFHRNKLESAFLAPFESLADPWKKAEDFLKEVYDQLPGEKDFQRDFIIRNDMASFFPVQPTGIFRNFIPLKLNEAGKTVQEKLTALCGEYHQKLKTESMAAEDISQLENSIGHTGFLLLPKHASPHFRELLKFWRMKKRQELGMSNEEANQFMDPENETGETIFQNPAETYGEEEELPAWDIFIEVFDTLEHFFTLRHPRKADKINYEYYFYNWVRNSFNPDQGLATAIREAGDENHSHYKRQVEQN